MANASYEQHSFLGGEWSQSAQGRVDLPSYRTALNVCFNGLPIESGAWVRRPGTQFCHTTRGGAPGRLIKFDFQANNPYTMEFTDGFLRFTDGPNIITTNDGQVIVSISGANPAVVQTATAHGWLTGAQIVFTNLVGNPLLLNRQFSITVIDPTHFSIADAVTGANIDGSTIGAFAGGSVRRIRELVTVYTAGRWADVRSVQAETNAVLLNGTLPPQMLSVFRLPSAIVSDQLNTGTAGFSLGPAAFIDGPYLDPVAGGATVTPSGTTGSVTLTVSFPAYSATQVYKKGDFVNSAAINYQSLQDNNLNNVPAGSPTFWAPVSAGLAVGPNGFVGTDVGRMIRLFSQPSLWDVGTAYVTGNKVMYNSVPYIAVANSTGATPDAHPASWAVSPTSQLWTWGKITAINNLISGTLAGSVNIGNMTQNGGLAASFDGITDKDSSIASRRDAGGVSVNDCYVGKDYTGSGAQQVAFAIAWPTNNLGFSTGQIFSFLSSIFEYAQPTVVINLRAKASLPASPSDGTLLGSSGPTPNNSPVTIPSNDQVTAWNFVWLEIVTTIPLSGAYTITDNSAFCAQAQFFAPTGTGAGTAVTFSILGPPLLYTVPIVAWRLGLYSDTTGYPKCGTYHEGRIWLSGAVANRIDGSIPNTISPTLGVNQYLNFAPTQGDGTVTSANAISYTFDAPDVNQIYWMEPDLQGIVCGTQAGEWLVQATSQNLPLTPTTIQAHRVTKIKCANIEPRRTEHTIVFAQLYQRKVMEYFADVYSGKFSAPNLSLLSKHLTAGKILELAYQQELAPVIWARRGDGALLGCTYKRDTLATSQGPTFAGWHKHTLGSGRIIESIAVGPSGGTNSTLMMVTNDATTGIRHVEMLTDIFEEGDDPTTDAWHLDDAVLGQQVFNIVSGGPYGSATINGLWHLNGKTVTVFARGLDCGDFTVSNGAVVVPYGDSVSAGTASGQFTAALVATNPTIIVGFTYNSDGQLVRPSTPQESGARQGPALGKVRRNHKYAMLVVNTAGLSIGEQFTALEPVLFKSLAGVSMPIGTTFTGIYKDTLQGDYSLDGMICWRISRPLPAIVAQVGGFIDTKDE